jgi:hypothetical protein
MRILVIDQAPRTAKSQPPYDVAAIETLLNSYASPGTKVEIGFPDDFAGSNVFLTIGAQSALNGLHHMMETPAIVRKIFWAAQNGYDAVISSNTFEPGVDGGRLAVGIPVIGLMRPPRWRTGSASRCRSPRMCPILGDCCAPTASTAS